MKIIVPLDAEGRFCPHFGQSTRVLLAEADPRARTVASVATHPLPAHSPGALPRAIAALQPDVVIAGSIGQRAVIMLAEAGIRVIQGAQPRDSRAMIDDYLADRLQLGANQCEGDHHHDHDHHH